MGARKLVYRNSLLASVVTVLATCSGCGASPRSGAHSATSSSTTTTAAPTTTTDPGLLPQTDALPPGSSVQFEDEMAALWQAVDGGSPSVGAAAFFPESAYLRLKEVSDPSADYTNRLVAEFDADVLAAHALVSGQGAQATLVEVDVPERYAHWVPPGVCANRFGYYEVANARVVYSQGGTERSFAIASLISWRGLWYVVHLGSVLRSGSSGVVDDPQLGAGTSAPSSTC